METDVVSIYRLIARKFGFLGRIAVFYTTPISRFLRYFYGLVMDQRNVFVRIIQVGFIDTAELRGHGTDYWYRLF
jgi:hypothetical protein